MTKIISSKKGLETVSKAVEQLEQNARELKDAFILPDGTYLEEDKDIRCQVSELESTAKNLRELSKVF